MDRICEEILLSSGLMEEAYRRYGVRCAPGGTYLARYRALAKKYPDREPEEMLTDLVATTPGEEGKWFATAKELGLHDRALDLARRSPCDPRTLARAARDHVAAHPDFALEAGLLALEGMVKGAGWEITGADALAAFDPAREAAHALDRTDELRERVRGLMAHPDNGGWLEHALRS